MILTTTSKSPTPENRKNARALAKMIPDSEYQPRGQRTIDRMVELARKEGHTRVVIFQKKPAVVKAVVVGGKGWKWHPKSINISDIKITDKRIDYLKCKDKFLIDFFDLTSEDSEFELVYDNKIMVRKNG